MRPSEAAGGTGPRGDAEGGDLSSQLSAVIVNYNSGALLARCVASIQQSADPCNAEVIVVDNGSEDGSLQRPPSGEATIRILENGYNAGFPHACNQGIQVATGRFILLLNPDTEIQAGTLAALLDGLQGRSPFGICTVAHSDGQHVYSPCYAPPSLTTYVRSLLLRRPVPATLVAVERNGPYRWSRVEGFVSGACLAISRDAIERIGPMDESLFWAEDADWCERARQAGISIGYCDQTSVFHHRGAIARRHLDIALYYQYVSKPRFVRKHGSAAGALALTIVITVEVLAKWLALWLLPRRRGDASEVQARARAYRAVLAQLWRSERPPWEQAAPGVAQ